MSETTTKAAWITGILGVIAALTGGTFLLIGAYIQKNGENTNMPSNTAVVVNKSEANQLHEQAKTIPSLAPETTPIETATPTNSPTPQPESTQETNAPLPVTQSADSEKTKVIDGVEFKLLSTKLDNGKFTLNYQVTSQNLDRKVYFGGNPRFFANNTEYNNVYNSTKKNLIGDVPVNVQLVFYDVDNNIKIVDVVEIGVSVDENDSSIRIRKLPVNANFNN